MTLAPVYLFFPASKPVGPPTSVHFTLWLSRMAAVGVACRPSACRTLSRSRSCIRSRSPSRLQRMYHLKTVDHGGKSWGNDLHETPVLVRYRIAFRNSRGGCCGFCRFGYHWGALSSDSTNAHSSSVRSDGYRRRSGRFGAFTSASDHRPRNHANFCGTPSKPPPAHDQWTSGGTQTPFADFAADLRCVV